MIGALVAASGTLGWWGLGGRPGVYAALTPETAGTVISADAAYRRVLSGDLILIDIRRPDEWRATGSPAGAVQLDMRRDDFTDALRDVRAGAAGRTIALICARGVRSARLSNRLIEAGFVDVMNVSEGMFGSADGPGWIARGLPLQDQG